ncbi:MAG: serine hydrolase, partial [Leptolyngbyaceae bacterium]|nr:serine hydrolase [Leptolyngbyaceae bacterium]
MSDLQGRSRRLRKPGNQAPNMRSSHTSASGGSGRKRRRRPGGTPRREGSSAQDSYGASRRRDPSPYDPRRGSPSQNSGQIAQNPPGAIVKANTSYGSRDRRQMPLGPDTSRRRPQVGAYAPAFNPNSAPGGRRSPNARGVPGYPVRYPQSPSQNSLYRPDQALPAFPGSEPLGDRRPTQRLNPRPVSQSRRSNRLARRVPDKPKKPTPAYVYVVRLLILGVGIGVISGTTISFFNPIPPDQSVGQMSQSAPGDESASNGAAVAGASPTVLANSSQSLATPLQLGQEMTSLLSSLQSLSADYSGLTPGIFLYDLNTTNYLSLNGEQTFSSASTIKVPILVALFQDVEAGRLSLDETWTMEEYDVATGSGDMQYDPVGTQYSALTVATKMIIISDNTATNILVRKLGGANALNQRFQSWGLTSTVIRNPLPDLDGTNTTSPKDLSTLMKLVSDGELLPIQFRDQMLRIMERTKTRTLLPQGIGPEAQIAHKTGDIGLMVGDVGLIDMPSGKRYALTVL